MDDPETEIVDGLPVFIRPRDKPKPVIRVIPKKRRKKDRVHYPLSISKREQRELTFQMRHALKNLFSGMSKKDSGKTAGYSEKSAIKAVNNALRIAAGNKAFLEEMERQNISNEKLITILDDGLEATHPLSKDNKKDYKAIYNFWRDAVKLKDGFPAKKVKTEEDHRHVHIHITADDIEGLNKYERMRREAIDGSSDPY